MRCSFVQFGDVHLGTLQYDSPERLDDFGRAWMFTCEHIARIRPDFAICTGDLFNRFAINPITFDQAFAGLSLLRDAGVPIVDIQGNHDRVRFGEPKSWLQTFADQGLLTYLDVDTQAGELALRPTALGSQQGSYVEWSGCRIFGLRYLGASTERVLQQIEPALQAFRGDGTFNILTLHAGLEGIVPHLNADITTNAVERLRGVVDYVALGHIHKYYAVGNYAYNGGSLETWSAGEWGWPRGLIEVAIDTERTPVVATRLVDVPRRPFHVVRVDVDPFETPRDLHQACWERLRSLQGTAGNLRPVVLLYLAGRLRFDESDVQVNKLEDACRQVLDALVAKVRVEYDARDFVTAGGEDEDQPVDRKVLERLVLRARISQDARHAENAGQLASVASDLKEGALRNEDGPALVSTLRVGLDRIRANNDLKTSSLVAVDLALEARS